MYKRQVSFKASGIESSLYAKVDEGEVRRALSVLIDLNAYYAETTMELTRVVCILAIALGLFALSLSALLWRGNDLAHELNFTKLDYNQEETESEQDAPCKNDSRVGDS